MNENTEVKVKRTEGKIELLETIWLSVGMDVVYFKIKEGIEFFENFFNHVITEIVVADSDKNAKAAFKGMVPLVANDIIFFFDGEALVSSLKVDDVKKKLQFSEFVN